MMPVKNRRVPGYRMPGAGSDQSPGLAVVQVKNELRVDSRLLAKPLSSEHGIVCKLLTDHAADFRQLGMLRLRSGERTEGGQRERFVLLNEDQTYLLLTYGWDLGRVRELKIQLVKAFREARQAQELDSTDYLPTYHALHHEIHLLAAGVANERFVHMNINKLVNKVAGVESGQRSELSLPRKSMVIAAQHLASVALRGATNHHEGYEQVKGALERLRVAMFGGADR